MINLVGDSFSKVSVLDDLPTVSGDYIVFATSMMGNLRVLLCHANVGDSGKVHWSCSNQIVTHWLRSK